jgi:hypothetical protein
MALVENSRPATEAHHRACDELGTAINGGKLGDIVAKHEKLILQYYRDVQRQAIESFSTARLATYIGSAVLILTLIYTLGIDGWARSHDEQLKNTTDFMTVAIVGTVAGAIIQVIAAVAFALYGRSAKQFGAFHICLERTHRYLLAYKVTEHMTEKEDTLHDLVCIMANAPMITREDIASDFRTEITTIADRRGARFASSKSKTPMHPQ